MERFSRQREAIRLYLSGRKDHPTAEQIYGALKSEIPNLSLATVYRNLSHMSGSGEIRRLLCEEDASVHFDYDTSAHSHFFCRSCGSLSDVASLSESSLKREAEKELHVTVDSVSVTYYGLCEKCRENAG